MKQYDIRLAKVPQPPKDCTGEPVMLTDATIQERLDKVLQGMKNRGLEQLVVYGDAEHCGNFQYLMGYFTRFEESLLVLDADGGAIGDNPARIKQIREGLVEALRKPDEYPAIIQRRVPRQLKHFAFAPLVSIHNDAQRPVTVLEITAPDRPGLLARIGKIFLDFDLSLQNAKIATLGERVEDIFFITDAHHQPLADPELCARLQDAIVQQLSHAHGETQSTGAISI